MLKQLPKEKLIKDRWYLGRGRNSNIAYWDGQVFITLGLEMNIPRIKIEEYYTEKEGCFQPFHLIDEGEIIEPFGNKGWDKHYGKTLKIEIR